MSEPSREHVEAVAFWLLRDEVFMRPRSSRDVATDILTSTDPAVLDAMQDALVRAGRLTEERRFVHAPFRQQCRLVTEWQEDQP